MCNFSSNLRIIIIIELLIWTFEFLLLKNIVMRNVSNVYSVVFVSFVCISCIFDFNDVFLPNVMRRVHAFHFVPSPKFVRNKQATNKSFLQMSISISSSTTATVPRFLSDFERSQSLMPSIVEQALIHGDEENVNAQDLLHRLDMTPKEREVAMMALHDENPDQHLLNVPSLLSNLECKRLRNFIDSKIMVKQQGDFGMDDVDHCPDFQIHMTETKLRKILGKNTMDQLLQVPCQLMDQNQKHHSDTIMSGDGWQDGNNVGIFLRRYEPDARPWMPFHLDQNAFTVNVALNSDSEFEGGRLLALYSNQIEIIPRNEGDVTCHRGSVVHGVSCITQGCRYSMILFFH